MSFGKSFAFLGVIFGCFVFASMVFPGGVVESTANGTVNTPGVATFGGLGGMIGFLLLMALTMLGMILLTGFVLAWVRMKNRADVAVAYGVDLESFGGMTPMQVAEMLNQREETHIRIAKSVGAQPSARKTDRPGPSEPVSNGNSASFHWLSH